MPALAPGRVGRPPPCLPPELMAGQERVVSASPKTNLQGCRSRILPDGVKAELHRKMAEPGSAEKG
jgi:hypothetical protein